MQNHYAEQLTLFAEDSPVKTSPLQEKESGSTENDQDFGPKCSESSMSATRVGFLLRIALLSEHAELTGSSATWNQSATPHGRMWFQLQISEQPTDDSDAGLWRTAVKSRGGSVAPTLQQGIYSRESGESIQVRLDDEVQLWPTVTVTGNHNRKGLTPNSGDGLSTVAVNWPTPKARDYRDHLSPASMARNTPDLPILAAIFATGKLHSLPQSLTSTLGRLLQRWTPPACPRVNVIFVTWLMGFPRGWFDDVEDINSKPSATP